MSNIIETKVAEFTNSDRGFTSIDIANAIKTDGTWVRNSEVAAWLRSWTPPMDYSITRIRVELADGTEARAAVYMPTHKPVTDYTGTDQTAMTPAEFEALHGFDPIAVVTAPTPDVTVAIPPTPGPLDTGLSALDSVRTMAGTGVSKTTGDVLRDRFNFPKVR